MTLYFALLYMTSVHSWPLHLEPRFNNSGLDACDRSRLFIVQSTSRTPQRDLCLIWSFRHGFSNQRGWCDLPKNLLSMKSSSSRKLARPIWIWIHLMCTSGTSGRDWSGLEGFARPSYSASSVFLAVSILLIIDATSLMLPSPYPSVMHQPIQINLCLLD
jgi:hypothetical protein